jgi:hypothetical protein
MSVTLIQYPNPFTGKRILGYANHGNTVRDYMRYVTAETKASVRARIWLNDEEVPEADFDTRTTKENDRVIVKLVPTAPVVAALVFIAAIVFVALVGIGVTALIKENIRKAQEQLKNQKTRDNAQRLAGIRGGSNGYRTWEVIQVILGKPLVVPCYAAHPFTSISGTDGVDQWVTMLFLIGYGQLKVTNLLIGEALLASNVADARDGTITNNGVFTDAVIEIHQNGDNLDLYPAVVKEERIDITLSSAAAATANIRRTALNVTSISVDVEFYSGLGTYDDNGALGNRSVALTPQYRATGDVDWISLGTFDAGSNTITKAKNVTCRYTILKTGLAAGQYDVQVVRTTADTTNSKILDECTWTVLRSHRATEPVLDTLRHKIVLLAVKIKADATANGVIDKLSCEAEAIIPAYDGTGTGTAEWVAGATRNPAAAFLWMLRGNMNPRIVPDAAIHWASLEAWYAWCNTNSFYCDAVIDDSATMREWLDRICGTARASVTLIDGLYGVVQDVQRSTVIQVFTPRNSWNFSGSKSFDEKSQAIRASFINETGGWVPDEEIIPDDGYAWLGLDHHGVASADPEATLLESVDLWGITVEAQVWKQIRYMLAVRRLRPEVFTIEADAEALACTRGDLVIVQHDVPMLGLKSGRVNTISTLGGEVISFSCDEELTMVAATAYVIRYRKVDQTISAEVDVDLDVGTVTHLHFTTPMATADGPAVGDLFIFGIKTLASLECIVDGIELNDDLSARLTLFEHAVGVFAADSGDVPVWDSKITKPQAMNPADVVEQAVTPDPATAAAGRPTYADMVSGDLQIAGKTIAGKGIASPNFVAGVSGWQIAGDGDAEFNDVIVRGEFVANEYTTMQGKVIDGPIDSSNFESGATGWRVAPNGNAQFNQILDARVIGPNIGSLEARYAIPADTRLYQFDTADSDKDSTAAYDYTRTYCAKVAGGISGEKLQDDGGHATSYAQLVDEIFHGVDPWTTAGFIKFTTKPGTGDSNVIFTVGFGAGGADQEIYLYADGSAGGVVKLRLFTKVGGASMPSSPYIVTGLYADGLYHHFVIRFNPTTDILGLHLDGVLVASIVDFLAITMAGAYSASATTGPVLQTKDTVGIVEFDHVVFSQTALPDAYCIGAYDRYRDFGALHGTSTASQFDADKDLALTPKSGGKIILNGSVLGNIAGTNIDIDGLTEDTAPAAGDFLLARDTSVGANKKIEIQSLLDLLPLPMSCLEGCAASNAADADNDITLTKGQRRDSTNAVNIVNPASLTKQIDFKWAAGSAAGGADLGMQIDTALIGTPTDNRAYFTTKADHHITDQSTVRVVNCSDEAHFNCSGVATVTGARAFWIPIAAHADVAVVNVTEGVVIAASEGAVATKPGCTYYEYLITDGTNVDALFSISATSPDLPAGWTHFRVIETVPTGSTGLILPGTWSEGNQRFDYTLRVPDYYMAACSITRVVRTLSVPPLSRAFFSYDLLAFNSTGAYYSAVTELAETDYAPTGNQYDVGVNSELNIWTGRIGVNMNRRVNADRQIGTRNNNASCAEHISTIGYWLPLGVYDYP